MSRWLMLPLAFSICLSSIAQLSNPAQAQEAKAVEALRFRYTGFFVRDVPATVRFFEAAFGLKLRYLHPVQAMPSLKRGTRCWRSWARIF
jgi:hypothetical protein